MHTNGLTELAPHKIAALVTFLIHDLGASGREVSLPAGFALERLGAEDLQPYRDLYRRVGADWLWFSRLRMPDDELREILGSPEVHALALVGPEGAIGLLELDFREVETPELAFFGLVPAAVGGGFGRGLMGEALRRTHAAGFDALHVHTCSLDHPKALAFYARAGFRPVRRALEVFDDPRLDGTLPREAAAWLPLIET